MGAKKEARRRKQITKQEGSNKEAIRKQEKGRNKESNRKQEGSKTEAIIRKQ